MLLGDIGETLKLAAKDAIVEAKMRLFHPIGFMLASPADSAEDALAYFKNAWVEDKYDGIRAQAHCSGDNVRFFPAREMKLPNLFPNCRTLSLDCPKTRFWTAKLLRGAIWQRTPWLTASNSLRIGLKISL